MADDEYSSSGGRSWTYVLLFVLVLVILVLLLGGWYVNHKKTNQLSKSQERTKQQQMQKTQKTSTKATPTPVTNDPAKRLAIVSAYATSIRPYLTKSRQADLNAVMVYVNGNPKVLINSNQVLPTDVAKSVANLKIAAKNLKLAAVATALDNKTYTQGEIVKLTGTIAFVTDDEELGGGIFTLTQSDGSVFYLHFNDSNSTNIKTNMLNDEIKITIKVTSKLSEPLSFQVIGGPTPVAQATTATTRATSVTPTP